MASLTPYTGKLGTRLAAHLLRRTTYNYNRSRIDEFAQFTPQQALNELLKQDPLFLSDPLDPEDGQPWVNVNRTPASGVGQLKNSTTYWWLDEARRDRSIGHKMAFFIHTCFVCSGDAGHGYYLFDHLALLRKYALGNFRQLAEKMVLDNLMLYFLDNTLNNKDRPNENFAREFFELFTIGKGEQIGPEDYTNYTEQDIREAARLLTGFKASDRGSYFDPDTNIPRGFAQLNQHDTGNKTFSAAFQNRIITGATSSQEMYRELTSFVDMIYEQEATAFFTCRKLYRFFVNRNITPEIEQDIITPLAATFRDNNYEILPVLEQLFASQHFYDLDDNNSTDQIIGSLIKSPLDLWVGAMNHFHIDVPDVQTETYKHYIDYYREVVRFIHFDQAGFRFFFPTLVAGYPGYYQGPDYDRNWFNGSTIIARYTYPKVFLTGRRILINGDTAGVILDIVNYIDQAENISDPENAETLVRELLQYIFPEAPSQDRLNYFLNDVFLQGLSPLNWKFEWQNYKSSGDDSDIKIQLNNLIEGIMYSPEYQTF